jgi:hypothetical protein
VDKPYVAFYIKPVRSIDPLAMTQKDSP